MKPAITAQQTPDGLRAIYEKMRARLTTAREQLQRPLTLAEKILFGHIVLEASELNSLECERSFIDLEVDHVAMQNATAQMVALQFEHLGKPAAVPASFHMDHLLTARKGATADLLSGIAENGEVYNFLRSAGARYGIDYWGPKSGIIHTLVAERYAFPGALFIGTDSHTVHAGGLAQIAIGVGGADAVDALAGLPFNVLMPKKIGVKLTGKLSGWAAPKDIIVKLLDIMTVEGGTNAIVEYFGPGVAHVSAAGRMTATNMGAEYGATTSIFPFDERTKEHFVATDRKDWIPVMDEFSDLLQHDPEIEETPDRYFDQVIEIDLSTLEPHVSGPHSPDNVRPISALAAEDLDAGIETISYCLIGACTNSHYSDMVRASNMIRAARALGLELKVPLGISPGSDTVMETMRRDGLLEVFEDAGVTVFASACGPCIGRWQRDDVKPGEDNVIFTSYNRNFDGRNDGSKQTRNYIGSVELTVAMAFGGTLRFNPLSDTLDAGDRQVRLSEPDGADLPDDGYVMSLEGYIAPPEELMSVPLEIAEGSDRIALLERFAPWDGKDLVEIPILVTSAKVDAEGKPVKFTTDHISKGGKFLRWRGHIANISTNYCMGVTNPWTEVEDDALNVQSDTRGKYHEVALQYRENDTPWAVVGHRNVGEGSSREHAAIEPRWLGCRVVIATSFARIHETNLKKQGLLALTFSDESDLDFVLEGGEGARLSVSGLSQLAPGKNVQGELIRADGTRREVSLRHSLNEAQIAWFKAGSCLNFLAS